MVACMFECGVCCQRGGRVVNWLVRRVGGFRAMESCWGFN